MNTPQQLWGEPEAGIQTTLFGGSVEYRPKGAGRKVQITLDDQVKLHEYTEKIKSEKEAANADR